MQDCLAPDHDYQPFQKALRPMWADLNDTLRKEMKLLGNEATLHRLVYNLTMLFPILVYSRNVLSLFMDYANRHIKLAREHCRRTADHITKTQFQQY